MGNFLLPWAAGTTKRFTVLCKIDGSAVDITGDTVTFRMKENQDDTDTNAKVIVAANVADNGASGIASFEVTPALTKEVTPQKYYADIEWVRSNGQEYVEDLSMIQLLDRTSDVPA